MIAKVEICGVDTSALPVIPESRLKDFYEKINAGDKQAREDFIRGNLRLVLSIVQRFALRGENMDDLFQVGCVGLIKAVDRFDVSLGLRFSTYAVPMVIGELKRYLRDGSPIRVSRSVRDLAYRAFQAKQEFIKAHGQEPTIEQLASKMKIEAAERSYALGAVQEPVSLFEPVYQDGGDALSLMDSLSDEKNSDESWLTRVALKDSIEKLPPREKNILRLRYFEGKTQMQVAGEIGISQAQVSRLERSALKSLKKNYEEK